MKPINQLIAGIALAMLVATPMSMAQVIEEITVTARKKSENLQDVPIILQPHICFQREYNNSDS